MGTSTSVENTGHARSAALSKVEVGDVTVTYLPDGIHRVEAPTHYLDCPESRWVEHPEVIDASGLLVMSVGGILIQTKQHNVLVDTGIGPCHIDVAELTGGEFRGDVIGGELLDSLAQVGLVPADIHGVVFTHLHVDHVGWVQNPSDPAEQTFGNSTYYLHSAELDYWSTETDPLQRIRGASDEQIAAIRLSLVTFDAQVEILPGITVVPTTGHTPGHTSVLVQSQGEQLLVLGDALHCPVELQHHGMKYVHDQDVDQAQHSRETIRELLLQPGTYFAGGHFPNQIFGRITAGNGDFDHCLEYPAAVL